MSRIPGLSTLRGDGLPSDPREAQFAAVAKPLISPEIQKLFESALAGTLPRTRPLKSWEPDVLNERHITIIMMRASGLMKQREIAEIMGLTEPTVSVVLNHPDAEYLISRLQAARFSTPTDFEVRLQRLNAVAVDAIEELLEDKEIPALRRAPMAFKLLEFNGHSKKNPAVKVVDNSTNVTVNPSPTELSRLSRAIEESRQVQDVTYVDISGPGGELPASPPRQLPPQGGTDAPSIGGPQGQERYAS